MPLGGAHIRARFVFDVFRQAPDILEAGHDARREVEGAREADDLGLAIGLGQFHLLRRPGALHGEQLVQFGAFLCRAACRWRRKQGDEGGSVAVEEVQDFARVPGVDPGRDPQ